MDTYEESFAVEKPPSPWWRRWLKRLGKILLLGLIAIVIRQAWFHHEVTKKLEEALAEMDRTDPGWRLEEIEAAREQIPEEENSARVVVAAARLLPKKWPAQGFDDRFAHLAPEEQLAPEDFAELKRELEKVRPALEEAHKLAAMPRGRYRIAIQRNPMDTLLPDLQGSRRLVTLLLYDAMRHDQTQDVKAALNSCRAALNTAQSVGDEPFAISQLVRMAGDRMVCLGVERVLAQGEAPAEELASLQKALEDEDAFAALLVVARGERAGDQGTFDALESGDVSISHLSDGRPGWQERIFGVLYRDNFRSEHPLMLALMSRWVAIARLPMYEQAEAERQFDQEIRALPESAILTRLLLPALIQLGEASRRNHAYLRCMIVALAAERYRQNHKKWPESIDKLCPQFLSDVPVDPFDGKPFRYRRLEDGVVIYSVSSDRVDNNGNFDRAHPNQPDVDIGIRLWDVSKRRQPPQAEPKPG